MTGHDKGPRARAAAAFVSPLDIEQAWMGKHLSGLARGSRSGRSAGSSARSTPAGARPALPAAWAARPLLPGRSPAGARAPLARWCLTF
jgi:hypothetical protein